jgi:hypothetical protein
LPSEGALALQTAIRALSGKDGSDDERSYDQRQADALVDMGVWVLHQDCLPREQGLRPTIQVTMTLETLLGLSDQPADLDGVGPLPASIARHLAFDPTGTWRRLIIDPINGRCLDYGQSVYKPPPDLREHLIATNRTCVFPGCARHARRCDLDHHRPFDEHGPTADANMGPLCKRHHHMKHETKWRLRKHHDGYEWTDPTGHTYYSTPHRIPRHHRTHHLRHPARGRPPRRNRRRPSRRRSRRLDHRPRRPHHPNHHPTRRRPRRRRPQAASPIDYY